VTFAGRSAATRQPWRRAPDTFFGAGRFSTCIRSPLSTKTGLDSPIATHPLLATSATVDRLAAGDGAECPDVRAFRVPIATAEMRVRRGKAGQFGVPLGPLEALAARPLIARCSSDAEMAMAAGAALLGRLGGAEIQVFSRSGDRRELRLVVHSRVSGRGSGQNRRKAVTRRCDPVRQSEPSCSLRRRGGPGSDRVPPDLDLRLGLAAKSIAKR
jgi:hypothetical protein